VRVFHGGGRVVDRAGPDHHQQAVVLAGHDAAECGDGCAEISDSNRRAADGEKADQMFRRRQHGNVLDAFVVGVAGAVNRVVRHVVGRHCDFLGQNFDVKCKEPPGPAVFEV
jgi:hypothetical protein